MSEKSSVFLVVSIIIGISGLSLGAYSVFFQSSPPGIPGEDGVDGYSNLVVGILDPDQDDILSGIVEIRALISGSDQYTISIKKNGSDLGDTLPYQWNTTSEIDNLYNITVIVTDLASGKSAQDEILVNVLNNLESPNVYYCSSESEINNALTDIGTGNGNIIITQDIILSAPIYINDGGSYVIQGITPSITINCGLNMAFEISTVQTCVLKDLVIDADEIIIDEYAINIYDRDVIVDNIRIIGGSYTLGSGIYIDQSEIRVSNCFISEMYTGIHADLNLNSIFITGNEIIDCYYIAISIYSSSRVHCEGNTIEGCSYGIGSGGDECTIANNILYQNERCAIEHSGDNSTITGNTIIGDYYDVSYDIAGIRLYGADNGVITGNMITSYQNLAGTGYGIYIENNCDYITVVGNIMLDCDNNFENKSATTIEFGNNYT